MPCREGYDTDAVPRPFVERYGVPVEAGTFISDADGGRRRSPSNGSRSFGENGRPLTHAPSTYKIPTCSDVPADFRVELFEARRNREPTIHRSKAVGEPLLLLAISVFSAIIHTLASLAPGRVPPLDAPATREAILWAMDTMGADGS